VKGPEAPESCVVDEFVDLELSGESFSVQPGRGFLGGQVAGKHFDAYTVAIGELSSEGEKPIFASCHDGEVSPTLGGDDRELAADARRGTCDHGESFFHCHPSRFVSFGIRSSY
jgi:hypothetical protein